MTYPKYCNKNHLFVFINQKAKKVAVASATIYFLEESTMKNARIIFSTKLFKVNNQQVLAVSDLTGKPLRLHRPSRFASCLPDWVPDSMADP